MVIAVVGASISGVIGEAAQGFFKPRLFPIHLANGMTSMQPSLESQRAADAKNVALASAILGGVSAFALAFAGGLTTGSPARGLVTGLGAQVAGVLVGALTALALFPLLFRQIVPDPNDLLTPMLVQAGVWIAIGLVDGVALAVGMGRYRYLPVAIGVACVTACLAAIVYHLLSGVLLSDSGVTTLLSSRTWGRLMAVFLLSILVAAGLARAIPVPPQHSSSAKPVP